VVLKVFFTFFFYKPKHCRFLLNNDHKWFLRKFHNEEKIDSFITSVIAVKSACICKLLRLQPDRRIVRLIMELVGNRSVSLTTANGKRSRISRLKNGIPHGFVPAPLLFLWLAKHRLQKVRVRQRPSIIMHADGDWQRVEGVLSKTWQP